MRRLRESENRLLISESEDLTQQSPSAPTPPPAAAVAAAAAVLAVLGGESVGGGVSAEDQINNLAKNLNQIWTIAANNGANWEDVKDLLRRVQTHLNDPETPGAMNARARIGNAVVLLEPIVLSLPRGGRRSRKKTKNRKSRKSKKMRKSKKRKNRLKRQHNPDII